MEFLFLLAKVLFWGLMATVLAAIEIEVEGKYGWAEMLPTWYRTRGFAARLYGKIMNGKPLTGYHSFMFFFPIFIFHAPFFMGTAWSITSEIMAWSMYFVWCVMWDLHWFVLNPFYAGKFSKNHVWWHAKSYWVMDLFPLDYLAGVGVSLGLAGVAALVNGSQDIIVNHTRLLVGFGLYTFILWLLAPFYYTWYRKMREGDDRGDAGIFHA